MIPLWKLKRELGVALVDLVQPIFAVLAPMMRDRHDRNKLKANRLTLGTQNNSRSIVILLLYQPEGVCASVYATCRYLTENGFSVFAVSNAPLKELDRQKLSLQCFQILERPNYGYDFGGYRDAVLHLLDQNIRPDLLFVLNDSIWFPTFAGSDFIDCVKQQKYDLYGAVMGDRSGRANTQHVQSYAFAFSKRACASAKFEAYWRDLPVFSSRSWTVRRCELKMTGQMAEFGFSTGARWSSADVDALLPHLSIAELEKMVILENQMRPRFKADCGDTLLNTPRGSAWVSAVHAAIQNGQMGSYFLLKHPILQLKLGFPMLKKNKEPYYFAHRAAYLREARHKLYPIISKEIQELQAKLAH
jgi:hypothetical protein